ncbi:Ribosome-associated inhibitor A [Rickettsiales bacterium Ac37b]|nr:Ribosome-associated inhibitor A [Rickettsiales bacterium Ac37b]
MEIIAGKHIDVGDALKKYVNESFSNKIEKKYSEFIQKNEIILSKEPHADPYSVDIIITPKSKVGGEVLKANGTGDTAYKAFDEAIGKIETQLNKHKNKLTSHHHKHTSANKESYSFIGSR